VNGIEQISIILGERRRLVLSVSVGGASDFTISNPRYKFTGQGETVEGSCELSEHDLIAYIEPIHAGLYFLTVEFDLATGEHIVRKVKITVS
jgi:hypothetical protein